MGCPACCGRTIGFLCVLIGIVIFGLTGVAIPNEIAPKLLAYSIDNVVLLTENDIQVQNKKWNAFVGGTTEIDITTEYDTQGNEEYYYFYNVTNPADFIDGRAKPNLKEVGPFGYMQIGRKYDVEFLGTDIVSYKSYGLVKRLRETACLAGLELLGHSDPQECIDPMTKVTVLDPNWARIINLYPFEDALRTWGPLLVEDIMNSAIGQTSTNLGGLLYPQLVGPLHKRYLASVGLARLKATVDAARTASPNIVAAQYNTISSLSDAASPIKHISEALTGGATNVFATDNVIESFYNSSSSFSPFSETGFDAWYRSSYTPTIATALANACSADGTTDCEARVSAIWKWLFSEEESVDSWVSKEETRTAAYTQYVSTLNSQFKCDGESPCDWNSAFVFSSHETPAMSFETYYGLFSTNASSAMSLSNSAKVNNLTSWAKWGMATTHCRYREECSSDAVGADMFNELLSEVQDLNRDNDIPLSTLEDQVCSIASMVTYHVHQNPVLQSMAVELYKTSQGVLEMDPQVSAFTSFEDFAYLQFGNSAFSKFVMGNDTLQLNPDIMVEFHLIMGQKLSVEEVKSILSMVQNNGVTDAIMKRSKNSTSDSTYYPSDYRANMDVEFSKTGAYRYTSLLTRPNDAGTETVASGIADLLSNYVRDYMFRQDRHLCNDPTACDYSKGGLFITGHAEDILYNGIVNPIGLLIANKVRSDRSATITCNKPKYYYENGTTSGFEETENDKFLRRYETGCPKLLVDPDCTDGGVLVNTYRTNSETGQNESRSQVWTRDSEDQADLRRYYNISNTFEIDGQKISSLPFVFALNLGGMYRDLEFQRTRGCLDPETCAKAHNTGILDRSKIRQVYYNNTNSTRWPNPVKIEGFQGSQFPPLYMDGVLATTCPERWAIYFSSMQGTLYYDVEEMTFIDYSANEQTAVPVCRYSISPQSYDDSILGLNNPTLMPPAGFIPLPPGETATEPTYIALGQPNFLMESKLGLSVEGSKFTGLESSESRHGTYFEVEQATGVSVRTTRRLGQYLRVPRGPLYPYLKESYYMFPTLYSTQGSAMDPRTAEAVGSYLLLFRQMHTLLANVGIVGGIVMILSGFVLYRRASKQTVKTHL